MPKALRFTTDQWVKERLGGYVRLAVSERREVVAELAAEGLSQRQIAAVVGVDHKTVCNDLRGENSPNEAVIGQENGENSPSDQICLNADETALLHKQTRVIERRDSRRPVLTRDQSAIRVKLGLRKSLSNGDAKALAFVLSKNLARRHLKASRRWSPRGSRIWSLEAKKPILQICRIASQGLVAKPWRGCKSSWEQAIFRDY